MNRLRTLDDLRDQPVSGRRMAVRVDFNVPRDGDRILDRTRLEEALPTLRELGAAGARTVLLSHCGRPDGKPDPALSLEPIAGALAELLGQPVGFATDCVGEAAAQGVARTEPGGFCLLENLRFHPGEKANDAAFADRLAELADGYVNDAFGSSHRAHASIVGLPVRCASPVAGRLLEKELRSFDKLLRSEERPFVAVLGGAKISGKIDTLEALLGRIDTLLVGGGMANTFLAAHGHELGGSLVADQELDLARRLLEDARDRGVEVRLPIDLVVTDRLEAEGDAERAIATVELDDVGEQRMAVDVGAATLDLFAAELGRARRIFWNGPVGVFERPPFDIGCRRLAEAIADSPAFSVVGGGETVAAVKQAGVADRIDHVSTGGGASLDLVAGKVLPGAAVLETPA